LPERNGGVPAGVPEPSASPIPRRYTVALPALTRLELQDNLLNGTIPAFAQSELIVFNMSYNFLPAG
jgi:hypothetical protein